MNAQVLTVSALAAVVLAAGQSPRSSAVEVRHDASTKQYAVSIAGKPFTSYRYGPEFPSKPVFYPVMSPNGARVNREYPMVPKVPGESADHPHHESMFFTYDMVNGTNFWNSEKTGRRIEHREARVDGSALVALLSWKDKDGNVVLDETKRVTFGGSAEVFWMDHDITLTAPTVDVKMGDTKEGAFAIRLNDTLKEAGGTGRFINAEGLETAAGVWGKTSAWNAIRGAVKDPAGDKDVTVAIYAHPSGLNFPPYWHSRDYGLFSANPFGRKGYNPSAPERITTLAKGEQLRVRFRMAVYPAKVTKERLDQEFAAFSK